MTITHLAASPDQIADDSDKFTYCGVDEYVGQTIDRAEIDTTADIDLVDCSNCRDLFEQDEDEREREDAVRAFDLRCELNYGAGR